MEKINQQNDKMTHPFLTKTFLGQQLKIKKLCKNYVKKRIDPWNYKDNTYIITYILTILYFNIFFFTFSQILTQIFKMHAKNIKNWLTHLLYANKVSFDREINVCITFYLTSVCTGDCFGFHLFVFKLTVANNKFKVAQLF